MRLRLGQLLAVLLVAAPEGQAASSHDDRILFNKYKALCSEIERSTTEERLLLCRTLRRQEDIVEKQIVEQVTDICKAIARECAGLAEGKARNRLSYFSQSLGCSKFSQGCPTHADGVIQQVLGDINPVVEAIEAIERTGGRVQPALKIAVYSYAEAREIGKDLQRSIDLVNLELQRFYQNSEIGCAEDPEFADDPPPNACTAKIDRQFQARAVNAVLNWNNENSVVRDTTRAIMERWDIDRLRAYAKK